MVNRRTKSGRSRSLPASSLPPTPAPLPIEAVKQPPTSPRDLDAVIHERTRLGIIGALAANERLSFGELKALLKSSDGNLSAHARRLEDAGYIVAMKRFEGRLPRTVGSSRVDLQACKLEYSIVSPK